MKFDRDGGLMLTLADARHPHGIWVHGDRVYVLDRENNRIQIFTTEGEFVSMWLNLERPTDMYVDREAIAYVSELEDHVTIQDLDGNLIGRFGSERSQAPGKFWGPHAIWADSQGAISTSVRFWKATASRSSRDASRPAGESILRTSGYVEYRSHNGGGARPARGVL